MYIGKAQVCLHHGQTAAMLAVPAGCASCIDEGPQHSSNSPACPAARPPVGVRASGIHLYSWQLAVSVSPTRGSSGASALQSLMDCTS